MRHHLGRGFGIALALAVIVTAVSGGAAADAGAIKYRQSVMKANAAHMGAMSTIIKGEGGDKADLAGHAHALAELSKIVPKIFPKGSGPEAGETGALPVIWEKRAEFEKVIAGFQAEAAKLAEVAKGGDAGAIGDQLGALGKNGCGTCHKNFRKK